MKNSVFDPEQQHNDVPNKIVAGLERLSEVFKILLWDKAKQLGLSPIQIQILLFIAYHKDALCNVSHLAKEFNVTKPTISDAVKALDNKGLLIKEYNSTDGRSYSIALSEKGKSTVNDTENFTAVLEKQVQSFNEQELTNVFKTLSELIFKLNRVGILSVQRTCFGCKFFHQEAQTGYCSLLEKKLLDRDIRLDCPEYAHKN